MQTKSNTFLFSFLKIPKKQQKQLDELAKKLEPFLADMVKEFPDHLIGGVLGANFYRSLGLQEMLMGFSTGWLSVTLTKSESDLATAVGIATLMLYGVRFLGFAVPGLAEGVKDDIRVNREAFAALTEAKALYWDQMTLQEKSRLDTLLIEFSSSLLGTESQNRQVTQKMKTFADQLKAKYG